jgi:hypothetical protein
MKQRAQGQPLGPENVCPIVPDRYDSAMAGEWARPTTCEALRLSRGHDEEEIRR